MIKVTNRLWKNISLFILLICVIIGDLSHDGMILDELVIIYLMIICLLMWLIITSFSPKDITVTSKKISFKYPILQRWRSFTILLSSISKIEFRHMAYGTKVKVNMMPNSSRKVRLMYFKENDIWKIIDALTDKSDGRIMTSHLFGSIPLKKPSA